MVSSAPVLKEGVGADYVIFKNLVSHEAKAIDCRVIFPQRNKYSCTARAREAPQVSSFLQSSCS